jgi:hypothetical protein
MFIEMELNETPSARMRVTPRYPAVRRAQVYLVERRMVGIEKAPCIFFQRITGEAGLIRR